MLHTIHAGESGPCKWCGQETPCKDEYGEFECLLCAGAQSGEALSYEAHRVWQNAVDEQPRRCRRKRAWRRG